MEQSNHTYRNPAKLVVMCRETPTGAGQLPLPLAPAEPTVVARSGVAFCQCIAVGRSLYVLEANSYQFHSSATADIGEL
jgi:hypothetical protein